MKTHYKIHEKFSKNSQKIFKKNSIEIIPSQNPDFDKNFEKISYWLIGFEMKFLFEKWLLIAKIEELQKFQIVKILIFGPMAKCVNKIFLKNFKCEKFSEIFSEKNGKIMYNYATG